ncbi:MarR family winged helix-turn-helix transcriptional regulator [Bacillus horti]|uniref:DNA-binding MarR family transcriptional regulator n=1 Tax=Caldalkalibacillus horti TaxID=77523 RepID=A0ABT9VTN9_9BACI|nr:MarR family winged helix-turn-helix transcriptional regulator [Bacillus horti]MDQ0164343.1 DNA-binding MarR family transcriptional regulator [Bacillus horti]
MQKEVAFTVDQVTEIERELRYISTILKQKGREILSNFPITPPQFIALQWLNELGDMTIGELSTKMYLACSTTTDLIDRMEANDLVERVRDTNDRRVVRIHLMDKGKKIIEEVLGHRRKYLAEVLTHFSEKDVKDLARTLLILHNEMK